MLLKLEKMLQGIDISENEHRGLKKKEKESKKFLRGGQRGNNRCKKQDIQHMNNWSPKRPSQKQERQIFEDVIPKRFTKIIK